MVRTKKVYDKRYYRYNILCPHMTVEHLSSGSNLLDIVQSWTENDFLIGEASSMVTTLRQRYSSNTYPFSKDEWREFKKQLNLKPNGLMVIHAGTGGFSDDFYGQHSRVRDPVRLIEGTGTPAPDGSRINLYRASSSKIIFRS